jgi:tRNA-dihydrouridine synthase A
VSWPGCFIAVADDSSYLYTYTHAQVTVKHRLGVDSHDSWEELQNFVAVVSAPPASVRHFVVHARKAVLGLTTAQNRTVPPLRHDWVYRLAAAFVRALPCPVCVLSTRSVGHQK